MGDWSVVCGTRYLVIEGWLAIEKKEQRKVTDSRFPKIKGYLLFLFNIQKCSNFHRIQWN